MANGDVIRLEWDGLGEFADMLEGLEDTFLTYLVAELTRLGLLVEEGAKALVFQDEGDLAASINFGPARRDGDKVVLKGGTNMKYALKLHEKPYGTQTRDKYENHSRFPDYYVRGRGERTRAKPSWRGYEPGGKYLQNAVNATEEDFQQAVQRAMLRTIGGV